MRYRRTVLAAMMTSLAALGPVSPATSGADHEPVYYLPAPEGTALMVTQGNHARFAATTGRTANERYAFDLVAADGPARFPVLAARGGTVIDSRTGRRSTCNEPLDGPRPACWLTTNYVLVDHGDGTSGLYMHLRRGDGLVRPGQVISAGQPVGEAGRSGWADEVGLQFQVQRTPRPDEVGEPGWFQTRTRPLAFADPDVQAQRADGVPQTDDVVVSGNPGPGFDPFRLRRRPVSLPAAVPLGVGAERDVTRAYDAGSPDGYGLHLAPEPEVGLPDPDTPVSSGGEASVTSNPGTEVRPLFGGQLLFAGCATGASASLGRAVVIGFDLGDREYVGVLGNLSDIEPALLDLDPAAPAPIIGPNDVLGHYGAVLGEGEVAALECPESDPTATDLFVGILRDATVDPAGEIIGGTPISPEPLVGERAYEGLAWWSGPLAAVTIAEEPGQPRPVWNRRATAHASHVPYGEPVRLRARVRDVTDIAEVRFRAWYPDWPRPAAAAALGAFDPAAAWRVLAVCRPPGSGSASDCRWNGTAQDALVTFVWDPSAPENQRMEAWLPRARTAMTEASDSCVPVSLAVEIVDTAGHVYTRTDSLPRPQRCDAGRAERARHSRLVYLDPLVLPTAPAARAGAGQDRVWPAPGNSPDPLNGAIVWRDRSDNEQGFRIYARRSWLEADCSVTNGPWQVVTDVAANQRRYRPRHRQVVNSIDVPTIRNVPGTLTQWDYAVSAFNQAGESRKVRVARFVDPDNFCSLGLEPPPELQ